jgi:hypothetical protein
MRAFASKVTSLYHNKQSNNIAHFTMSLIFRRSFATTTRLLRPTNGKPPPQERNIPPSEPRPSEPDPKSTENKPSGQDDDIQKAKKDIRDRVLGSLQPRSEHFILACLNPKLSREKRMRSGLTLLAAILMGTLFDSYLKPADKEEDETKAGEGKGFWQQHYEDSAQSFLHTVCNRKARVMND